MDMRTKVLLVVLLSALLHASWNALARAGSDELLAALPIACGAMLLGLPLMWWLPASVLASWPWVLASALVHQVYLALRRWA